MRQSLRHGMMMLALVGGVATAGAQVPSEPPAIRHGPNEQDRINVQLKLTDPQRQMIAEAVKKDKKTVARPPNFVASVGAPVPPAIELYMLPDKALAEVPAVKEVKYTILGDQLILVDPTTMRVVEIIPH